MIQLRGNANPKASQQLQGTDAVKVALTRRWLDGAFLAKHFSDATYLGCWNAGWGDEEVIQFAKLLSEGALPACEKIRLEHNQIGDAGFKALAAALDTGALPKCKAQGEARTHAAHAPLHATLTPARARAGR